MMIQLSMGSGFQRTLTQLGRMGADVITACDEGLEDGGRIVAANIVENYLSGQTLKRRTGNLARAVDAWLKQSGVLTIGVHEDAAVNDYAWLLTDEKKTIRPKKGKFLAIPIAENLTGSGVARYNSPREVEGGFFIKSKSGKLLFGYQKGKTKRAKFRPLFVLVKSVTIQGSGALPDGVMDKLDDIAAAIETKINTRLN